MNKPILFIETPRAGKLNHRFIVPTDYIGGDGLLSHFADSARQKPEGINFLATGKDASQTSGRKGWEQLILANVDVKHLSATQMTDINSFLKQRLIEVEKLVVETIDWNKTTAMVIPREELNQWLQQLEKEVGTLTAAKEAILPVVKQSKSESKRRWFIVIGIAALAVITGSFFYDFLHITKYFFKDEVNNSSGSELTTLETAKSKAQRLITAIGGNKEQVQIELNVPKTVEDLNNWTTSQAGQIPITGDWQVAWFISSLTNDGRDFAKGLWGQPLQELIIQDGKEALKPLVQCRIAIRNLMGVTDADKVYTPFFQVEDFGGTVAGLKDKITKWRPDSIKATKGCNTEPNKNETMIKWIDRCIIKPITGFEDDNELQKIKTVGTACEKVKFISPTAPNAGTIKNSK